MPTTPDPDTERHDQDTLRVLFWQVGEASAPDLVVTAREMVLFLTMGASDYSKTPCEDIHCDICYEFVATWRSLYQALDAHDRATVEAYLEERDVRAPTFPQALR
jgi:hypothetical protein